jgi:Xaa-Pro aminopeptidase
VHEGPHLISYYPRDPDAALQAGMTSSIEPGYYQEGHFGLRIENVAVVREAATEHAFMGTKFLCFEPLTLVPLAANLIDLPLLSPQEAGWVDAYHERVWETLQARITDHKVRDWLRQNTLPLVQQVWGVSPDLGECPAL